MGREHVPQSPSSTAAQINLNGQFGCFLAPRRHATTELRKKTGRNRRAIQRESEGHHLGDKHTNGCLEIACARVEAVINAAKVPSRVVKTTFSLMPGGASVPKPSHAQ